MASLLRGLVLRGLTSVALIGALVLAALTISAPSNVVHAAPLSPVTHTTTLAPVVPVTPLAPAAPTTGPVLLTGPWQSGSWMCEHWYNAGWWYTHCTQAFYTLGGRLYSLNPAWVPNFHGGPTGSVTNPTAEREPDGDSDDGGWTGGSGPVPWQGGSPDTYPWGWCTWGAAHLAYDNVNGLGNAKDWLANAQWRGMPTGTTPRLNATVVFQPGVDGASSLGHVAHVVRVYADGSFDSESMAQPFFGVYTVTHHVMQWGIAFIY